MHEHLNRNVFLVKEHVGMFKAANNFDIYDPHTGEMILHCREPNLGGFTKLLRFSDYKRFTPFDVHVTTIDGDPVLRASRGSAFLRSNVSVYDEQDQLLGTFKQRLLSIGGAFEVLDENGTALCRLIGKWTGWDFRFVAGERELAHVAKKWAGIGKEMFTSADNYILEIADVVPANSPLRQLILSRSRLA